MDESKLVLILDDDQERHDAFKIYWNNLGFETIHVRTVKSAIEALEAHVCGERVLAHVSLDHDLEDYGPSEYEEGRWREFTGRDVVQWMTRWVEPELLEKGVRVHSWNIVGGTAMTKSLQDAGFKVEHRPFKFDADARGSFSRGAKP